MTRTLPISASPRGPQSESISIAETLLAAYREAHPTDTVDTYDLWDGTLPEFGPVAARAKMAALAGLELRGDEAAAWAAAQALFRRFDSYDNYVFSVPMWNHGIPYILKQFIDAVSHSGMLFSVDTERGYTGLLTGKKAVVIYTSAVYDAGIDATFGKDFQSTYFEYWLRTSGINDITTIAFRQNLIGEDVDTTRSTALAEARQAGKNL